MQFVPFKPSASDLTNRPGHHPISYEMFLFINDDFLTELSLQYGSMTSLWSCKVSIPLLHTYWAGWANKHLTGILRLPSWQGCVHRLWVRLPPLGNRDYAILRHSNSPTWTELTLNCKLPYSGTWLWELALQMSVALLHNMRFIYPILFLIFPVLQTRW